MCAVEQIIHMIKLPTVKQKPTVNNPKFLVYFGKPKAGNIAVCMRNRTDNYRANTGDG